MSETKQRNTIFKKEGITIDHLLDMIYAISTNSWVGFISMDTKRITCDLKSEIIQIPGGPDNQPPQQILVYTILLSMSHHAKMAFEYKLGLNPKERDYHRSALIYGCKYVIATVDKVTEIIESMQHEELK